MLENEIEENEVLVENELLVEKEEVIGLDEVLEEVEVEKIEEEIVTEEVINIKKDTLGSGILVGIIDQIVVFAGALALQLLFALLIKLLGYQIVEQDKIFIIIYLLSNVLYAPICNKLKFERTFGSKVVLKK